jgi:hypothetical protein
MNYLNFTPSIPSQSTALLYSGCTAHFLLVNNKCSNKIPPATPLAVRMPNGDTITSTHTATLNMPSLPYTARQAHILPGLAQRSLLSVGQMCDSGCSVTFTAAEVTVKNGESTILTGLRDQDSGLWSVPLEPNVLMETGREHSAHNVYEQKSIQATITYLHACCFSPVTDTWLKATEEYIVAQCYGGGTWALKEEHKMMSEIFHHGAILRILWISRQIVRDKRITNSAVRTKFLHLPTMMNLVKRRALKYIGNVVREEKETSLHRFF